MKQILLNWNKTEAAEKELAALTEEYKSREWKSLFFHIYCAEASRENVSELTGKIRELFPQAHIGGTVSAGEILDGKLMGDGILVSAMFFACTEICTKRFLQVQGRESETGKEICEWLDSIAEIKAAELFLPGTSLDTQILFEEIEKCRKEIAIFGGYSGGHTLVHPEHFVLDEDRILDDSIVIAAYVGKDFHIDADKTLGWHALGRPFTVTKADRNWLIELDNRPAVEMYRHFLQIGDEHAAEDIFEFPLTVRIRGEEMLRGNTAVDSERGAVLLAGFIKEGMDVRLSYGNPSEIVEKVNERLESLRKFRPEAVLLYSCLARKTFWEQFVNIEMIPFASLCSTAGYHTWGEVLRNTENGTLLENNVTMLSIAMREGPAAKEELPEIRVDDSVLQGQASLMRRLTKLVSATTNELQQALLDRERMNKELISMNEKLQEMAEYDALTCIYNRGKIESLINKALDEASHSGKLVSLVMVDVDFFKKINDTYGHGVGDVVLAELSGMLKDAVEDIPGAAAGRWGGEEFFILLPETEKEEALAFSKELHSRIQNHLFQDVGHVTVSMGVTSVPGVQDRKEIFTHVDDALYEAKDSGRNRIVQYDKTE